MKINRRFSKWILVLGCMAFTAGIPRTFGQGFPPIGGMAPFFLGVLSSPMTGAQNVAVNSTISMKFSTTMGAGYSITWSGGNLTSDSFTYAWSADQMTLVATPKANLPSNTTITYTLIPATATTPGFAGSDGTPLDTSLFPASLTFTTAGGGGTNPGGGSTTNNPCSPTSNTNGSSYFLSKEVMYVQTGANPPVVDTANDYSGALFMGSFHAPTMSVSAVTVRVPNGTTVSFTNLFGNLLMMPSVYPSQEALDAQFPGGNYTLTIVKSGGNASANVSLPTASWPPTPQIQNISQLANVNGDVTVQWNPFVNATSTDSISLMISDGSDTVFSAPDLCIPIKLAPTDTSIVVPKSVFTQGKTYEGTLTFSKLTQVDSNSIPGVVGIGMLTKQTRFTIGTTGGTTQPPSAAQFTSYKRGSDGTLQLQLTGQAGATYTLESSTDLINWTTVTPVTMASAVVSVPNQPLTAPRMFYRAVYRP